MKTQRPFSWRARAARFACAARGLATLFRGEHNAWIHLAVAAAVVAAGSFLRVSRLEWVALIFAITLVFSAEAFNTAIESLADAVTPQRDPLVGRAKDLAAGGVLVASIGAAVIGLIIFVPRLHDAFALRCPQTSQVCTGSSQSP